MDVPSPSQFISNPHLKLLDDDMLFHIGIKTHDQNLKEVFGDVKVARAFHYLNCQLDNILFLTSIM